MTMTIPPGFRIVTSSAWADPFRPSVDAYHRNMAKG